MSARRAPKPLPPLPETIVCSVLRCDVRAECAEPGAPAPFCRDHWFLAKAWLRRAMREAFEEKRWEDYALAVGLCADDLDTKENRARELGFQGLVLARYFSKDHPRGVVHRMMGSAL